MAYPTTIATGDSKLVRYRKILGQYQNAAGAQPRNNPATGDGCRITAVKILRAMRGVNGGKA